MQSEPGAARGLLLPGPCRAGGGCTDQPGCHLPQVLPPALELLPTLPDLLGWAVVASPGPIPTPGAHEVPAATYSHSFCPCRGGTVAWPPVRAPESWAQLPILQAGDTAQGASQSTKPGPQLGTPHASPSPWGSSLGGSQLTQPGTRASGQAPSAQRAPAVGREQGRAVLLAPSSTVCPQALLQSGTGRSPWSLLLEQCQILNSTALPRGTGSKSLCFCPASMSRRCWETRRARSGTGTLLCSQVCAQAQFLWPALPSEVCPMIH